VRNALLRKENDTAAVEGLTSAYICPEFFTSWT
jgi:hypothetical protein